MADYDWFRDRPPSQVEQDRAAWSKHGFNVVSDGTMNYGTAYFKCLRGCGMLVWDPKTHMENVCVSYGAQG